MLTSVLNDIRLLFCAGDFAPYEEGLEIIRNSQCSEAEKRYMELLYKRVERERTYKKAVELMYHNCILAGGNTEYYNLRKNLATCWVYTIYMCDLSINCERTPWPQKVS